MNRRDALKASTAVLGGLLAACSAERAERDAGRPDTAAAARGILSADDRALVEELADTLLPTTPSSPGAKAAGAGAAIDLLVSDCYEPEAQQRLVAGLAELRGSGFASADRAGRERILLRLDAAARTDETHWLALARELSLRAYFGSEVGMTQALRYVMVPGRWEGCVPLRPGQPAWA